MVKFSKKLEYALISLRYISNSRDEIIRVRDISEKLGIPHDLLAKILQKLKKENILGSSQGINGGYKLIRKLNEIPLSELVNVIENGTSIVECMHDEDNSCLMNDNCTIKDPLSKIQTEFENILKTKMVSDFV
jgi:Rrf2 family protein